MTRTCSSLVLVDFDDTPEEAAFRTEVRDWLVAHAPAKGGPDDFSTGFLEKTMSEEEFHRRVKNWQELLVEHGWAGITWPKEFGGRGGTAMQNTIWGQEASQFGVTGLPSYFTFKDGQLMRRLNGIADEATLRGALLDSLR